MDDAEFHTVVEVKVSAFHDVLGCTLDCAFAGTFVGTGFYAQVFYAAAAFFFAGATGLAAPIVTTLFTLAGTWGVSRHTQEEQVIAIERCNAFAEPIGWTGLDAGLGAHPTVRSVNTVPRTTVFVFGTVFA